jgi:hypothetical protein
LGRKLKDYSVSLNLAQKESNELLTSLEQIEDKIEGLIFNSGEPANLRWGEVIPLHFTQQTYNNHSLKPEKFAECIILSPPNKRIADPESLIDRCIKLGTGIGQYLHNLEKRVVVLIVEIFLIFILLEKKLLMMRLMNMIKQLLHGLRHS